METTEIFVTISVMPIFPRQSRMKPRKRGRHPIGRKATTAAERDCGRPHGSSRGERQAAGIGTCQPPKGYGAAKAKLQAQGHVFERARSEAGFEEG
jgi:hypothetical protein